MSLTPVDSVHPVPRYLDPDLVPLNATTPLLRDASNALYNFSLAAQTQNSPQYKTQTLPSEHASHGAGSFALP